MFPPPFIYRIISFSQFPWFNNSNFFSLFRLSLPWLWSPSTCNATVMYIQLTCLSVNTLPLQFSLPSSTSIVIHGNVCCSSALKHSLCTAVCFAFNNNGSSKIVTHKHILLPDDHKHRAYSSLNDQCVHSLIRTSLRYQRKYLNMPLTQSKFQSYFKVLKFTLVKLGQKIEQ